MDKTKEKNQLRNTLFEKYFEVKDGISAINLVERMKDIRATWSTLHHMLEESVEYFDIYSSVDGIKSFAYKNENYLMINLNFIDYVVIDIKKNRSLSKEEVQKEMTPDCFTKNFGESHWLSSISSIFKYEGDVEEIVNYYLENKEVLDLPATIYYKLSIGEAWTYFHIDAMNGSSQLGFQTPDQFLYEHLLLTENLAPFGMQDATEKIGMDKMHEMFERIKTIKIPKDAIPERLYEKVSDDAKTEASSPIYSKK